MQKMAAEEGLLTEEEKEVLRQISKISKKRF
jgi:hypothetical protein